MTIEHMSVVSAGNGFVHLRSRNPDHCKQCAASSGCGIQLINKAMIRGTDIISVEVPLDIQQSIQAGDEITVAIDDIKLISLSLLQYFFPILLLVATTAVADIIIKHYQLNEIWLILAALLALSTAMLMVRYLSEPLISSAGKCLKLDAQKLRTTINTTLNTTLNTTG